MCILGTQQSHRSYSGDSFVFDFLGVVADVNNLRMVSVVEHQATVESGLKMRIKRKNPSPTFTSIANVISSNDLMFESLRNGHTCDIEAVLPEQSTDSPSDDSLTIVKRDKKCRKTTTRGSLRSHSSSKSRRKLRHFVTQTEDVIVRGNFTESRSGLVEDFLDSQESSNVEQSTGTENYRMLESSSNGASSQPQWQHLDSFSDKKRLLEIEDSEGTESEWKDTDGRQKSFAKLQSEDASSDGCERRRRDVGTEMCDAGVITDPDCLGPCEPGTSVILEGIVWNESNNGILVVNVTWRGKTYVGTLMDTTKYDWAPPRLREDSPPHDVASTSSRRFCSSVGSAQVIDGRRLLRKCRRDAAAAAAASTQSSLLSTRSWCVPLNPDATETTMPRQQLLSSLGSTDRLESSKCSPSVLKRSCRVPIETLLECSEPNCEKKYRRMSGLRYHQSHAHRRPSSLPGEATALLCVDGKKCELEANLLPELSNSLLPEVVDTVQDSESLVITSGNQNIIGISDVWNEKPSLLSRKRKADASSFHNKLPNYEDHVISHQLSYPRSSEKTSVDHRTNSAELNYRSRVEFNETCSDAATHDLATRLSTKTSIGQFSFLDEKMSCLSVDSNPNSPQKIPDSPLGNCSKDLRFQELPPTPSTHSSKREFTQGKTTLSPIGVSCVFAVQKLSVVESRQKHGTITSTTSAGKQKFDIDIPPFTDQSSDDTLTLHMEVEHDPSVGGSPPENCFGNSIDRSCFALKPKKVIQVCDTESSLDNTSSSENHVACKSTEDSRHLGICSELCSIATFDCAIFDKPFRLGSEFSHSEETPGALENVFQHPISGDDQRAEGIVRKQVSSTIPVARNSPLSVDEEHTVVTETQYCLISTRNGIHRKKGFDEEQTSRPINTASSQLSPDLPQLLPDLIEAFDDLPDQANAPSCSPSNLGSDGTLQEQRTPERAMDDECCKLVESHVDFPAQSPERKTCNSMKNSTENASQVSGEGSVPANEKGASALNRLFVRVYDFAKQSNGRQPPGLDTIQSYLPTLPPSQMPSRKPASDVDLSFYNSRKHLLSTLNRTKTDQLKHSWVGEPHTRLSIPKTSSKNASVQDANSVNGAVRSDPEFETSRSIDDDTIGIRDGASMENAARSKLSSECRSRPVKDVHRVQNDRSLSQVKGVTAQNCSRRPTSTNRQSSSGDHKLISHSVSKSPFNYASLLSPSSLVPAVVIPDLYGPK